MKIIELRLSAFGPFTNRVLDLSAGDQGLHVIFGPNEAGKSSALRAIYALLYGIPAQTADAYLHPYDKLRLGGRLRLSSGAEISFVRRKGNKGTLLGPDNQRLDDHVLRPFLAGETAEHFDMFWGIDHGRLVQGGHEILQGNGDVAEALFAAGSGASQLRALRKTLDGELDKLFAPRGHNPEINRHIRDLRDLRSAVRDATVSSEEWAKQDRVVQNTTLQIEQLTSRLEKLTREMSHHERLKRVLPLLAEQQALKSRRVSFGNVVALPEDFTKRRQLAESALLTARTLQKSEDEQLKQQEKLLADLGPTPPLAAASDIIDDLYKRLGSHRKALSDRPGLVARRSEQRTLATRLLDQIRTDIDIARVEKLRYFLGRRARLRKLATSRERLDQQLETAEQTENESVERAELLKRRAQSLPPKRDPEKLETAIAAALRRGDAETERDRITRTVNQLTSQCDADIARLGLTIKLVPKLRALRLPADAVISGFEIKKKELDDEIRDAKIARERATRKVRALDDQISALRKKSTVPSEDDLAQFRMKRDKAFLVLRAHWEKRREVTPETRKLGGKSKLSTSYQASVIEADDIADQMRHEADRVAELERLTRDHASSVQEITDIDSTQQTRGQATARLSADWVDAWKHVTSDPPPVPAARKWRDEFDRLIERLAGLEEAQHQLQDLNQWLVTQRKGLHEAMLAIDRSAPTIVRLADALSEAGKLLQGVKKDERELIDYDRKVAETNDAIVNARLTVGNVSRSIEKWHGNWHEAVNGLLPADNPAPDDVLNAIDILDGVMKALDSRAELDGRVAGIDRDADEFRADIRGFAGRLGESVSLKQGAEDSWLEQVQQQMAVVVQDEERRRSAKARQLELQNEVKTHKDEEAAAVAILAALRDEARCSAEDDLTTVERLSGELQDCLASLKRVEKELFRNGDGASIRELEVEAEGVDKDSIDIRLRAISEELPSLDTEVAAAREARATAQAELRQLQGPSVANEKAEEVQATLARLRDDVNQYSRLRVASTLLARRIDDFRQKNQAPLLTRASEFFRDITLGGFERLEADVEDDRPVLIGVRPDGNRVPTQGMSDGTVDQLYFALRLAAVEKRCTEGEPLPFIVDDVLVQFDDDRGAGALHVLADLASHTQVILFTHHKQVSQLGEAITARAGVVVHKI